MYKRLTVSGYVLLKNYFIYDSSDNTVEYLTEPEYESVKDIIDDTPVVLELKSGVLAKIAMSGNRFDLLSNSIVNAYILYKAERGLWHLALDIVDDRIKFSMSFNSDSLFYFDLFTFKSSSAVIPAYYAEYLVLDVNVRKREIDKILSFVNFKWDDSNNVTHVVKGVNNIVFY